MGRCVKNLRQEGLSLSEAFLYNLSLFRKSKEEKNEVLRQVKVGDELEVMFKGQGFGATDFKQVKFQAKMPGYSCLYNLSVITLLASMLIKSYPSVEELPHTLLSAVRNVNKSEVILGIAFSVRVWESGSGDPDYYKNKSRQYEVIDYGIPEYKGNAFHNHMATLEYVKQHLPMMRKLQDGVLAKTLDPPAPHCYFKVSSPFCIAHNLLICYSA